MHESLKVLNLYGSYEDGAEIDETRAMTPKIQSYVVQLVISHKRVKLLINFLHHENNVNFTLCIIVPFIPIKDVFKTFLNLD